MQEVLVFSTVIAPIILAVTQLFKQINIPRTMVPFVSLVIGMFIGYAAQPFTDLDLTLRLWAGALAGLSATGLFELATPSKGYTNSKGGDK